HPATKQNQKRVWVAEQAAKEGEKRDKEAKLELEKEAEQKKWSFLAAKRGEAEAANGKNSEVGFIYRAPPGLQEEVKEDLTEDEAVRAFKLRMLEIKTDKNFSSNVERSKLEKMVGRKFQSSDLTMEEQVERFPFLKDAPVESAYAKNVKVKFNPLGKVVRNVQCLRCKQYGHAAGEVECKLRGVKDPKEEDKQVLFFPA
ncbi:unnamed protein product, partial [Chrysoparadoxa australica]